MTAPVAYAVITRPDGFSLGIAEENAPGYYATNYPSVQDYDAATRWADEANRRLGLSTTRAMEIVTSSMRAQNLAGGRAPRA